MTDPTRATRPVGGPPPGSPPPPGPPGGPPVPPEPGGPDWRRITIGALVALTVLLALVLVLVVASGGGDDDMATDASTTTSSSPSTSPTTEPTTTSTADTTTTTSTSTTTTAPPPTTSTSTSTSTAAPPSTVAPARCTGRTSPNQPEPVAEVFYEAWTVADEACARQVATDEAIGDLFVFDGRGADWSFEGCEQDGDLPQSNCFFRYEGGSATFELRFGAVDGWRVESVTFTAD